MGSETPIGGEVPVVLSYGMGVDSTALLLRWLDDGFADLGGGRTAPLSEVVVITAMTGDEWPDTSLLAELHVLPRLAAAGVRYVQVARRGPSQSDGIAVLDDSRQPARLFSSGSGWALSDELLTAGTLPQVANGRRLCSLKWKGWPLDTWLAAELGGRAYHHVLGFNAQERRRAERDSSYSTLTRASRYPLICWGWDRADCERYITERTGAQWPKSCCSYCPFARDQHIGRYRDFPERAAQAMFLERVALAMNPRMTLFAGNSVEALVAADGNHEAMAQLKVLLDVDHAVYDVRRIYRAQGLAARSVTTVIVGTRGEARAWLCDTAEEGSDIGLDLDADGQPLRLWLRRQRPANRPWVEQFLVVAPHVVADKQRAGFAAHWAAAVNPAATLFDLEAPDD